MKVTYAPVVSAASGRFGGLVATTWKGIQIMRRFAIPTNPNTSAQQEVRVIFQTLNRAYATMTAELRAAWVTFAAGRPYLGRNKWIGLNVPAIKDDADITDMVGTPGDASTLGPTSLAVTPAATQLTCAIGAPSTPAGWTLTSAVAVCILDADWSLAKTFADLIWTEVTDESSPYECVLTGLTNDVLYQVRAFLKWVAPDGATRYSIALATEDTPAA